MSFDDRFITHGELLAKEFSFYPTKFVLRKVDVDNEAVCLNNAKLGIYNLRLPLRETSVNVFM